MLIRNIFLTILALLMIGLSMLMLSNLMCRTSLRTCTSDEDCPGGTICLDITPPEKTCAANYCKSAQGVFATIVTLSQQAESFAQEVYRKGEAYVSHLKR